MSKKLIKDSKNAPTTQKEKANEKARKEKVLKKRPAHRPSTYKSKFSDDLREYLASGRSIVEAAKYLKISRDTLYRWAKEHKDFGEALNTGRDWGEASNIEVLRAGALGQIKGFNVAAHQMTMRNLYGWDKNTDQAPGGMQINIANMNVLQSKSTSELLEHISNLKDDLCDVIDVSDFEVLENNLLDVKE